MSSVGLSTTDGSYDQWRRRIWPSKAILSFARIITRCKPPIVKPGENIFTYHEIASGKEQQLRRNNFGELSATASERSNRGGGGSTGKRGVDLLTAHWASADMQKIPLVFSDAAAHSSAFFLLTVEECRQAVAQQHCRRSDEPDRDGTLAKTQSRTHALQQQQQPQQQQQQQQQQPQQQVGLNGWLEGRIVNVAAEPTEPVATSSRTATREGGSSGGGGEDPRLGSVWVASVAVPAPSTSCSRGSTTYRGNNRTGESTTYSGVAAAMARLDVISGDLVVLHSDAWTSSHATGNGAGGTLLGIVQPWDPDADIKRANSGLAGASFGSGEVSTGITGGSASTGQVGALEDVVLISILICVDQTGAATAGAAGSGGGWAPQGAVRAGVRLQLAVVGNVMTAIRECQALMALRALHPAVQRILLQPATSTFTAASASGSMRAHIQDKPSCCPAAEHGEEDSMALQEEAPEGGAAAALRPAGVPQGLWAQLAATYNSSQLRALAAVCGGGGGGGGGDVDIEGGLRAETGSRITLLQGPPGTGKTRTILGVLSVFLAGGALPPDASAATRIVTGSSLVGDSRARRPLLKGLSAAGAERVAGVAVGVGGRNSVRGGRGLQQ